MTGLQILKAGFALAGLGASDFNKVIDYLSPEFQDLDADLALVASRVRQVVQSIRTKTRKPLDQQGAARLLLSEDLERVAGALEADPILPDLEPGLYILLDNIISIFSKFIPNIERPRLEIVDTFPPPFNTYDWNAFCPDEMDEQRFGIPKGIYLRKDRLAPFFSHALLAHEFIHTIGGRIGAELFAMGLEEGLADLLGSLYVTWHQFGGEVARNLYEFSRFGGDTATLWKLYVGYARQAFYLYKRFGLKGLSTLLSQGRARIHSVEGLILTRRFDDIHLPDSDPEPAFEEFANSLFISLIPEYIVSPLAKIMIPHIVEGATVGDTLTNSDVVPDEGRIAIKELSHEIDLFLLDEGNDSISYSNASFFAEWEGNSKVPIIRYDVKYLSNASDQ